MFIPCCEHMWTVALVHQSRESVAAQLCSRPQQDIKHQTTPDCAADRPGDIHQALLLSIWTRTGAVDLEGLQERKPSTKAQLSGTDEASHGRVTIHHAQYTMATGARGGCSLHSVCPQLVPSQNPSREARLHRSGTQSTCKSIRPSQVGSLCSCGHQVVHLGVIPGP
jgi:hypothetical protein